MSAGTIFPYIVADIGGTNARFGLVSHRNASSGRLEVISQHVYACSHFDSFEQALDSYICRLQNVRPTFACIAIAAKPAKGDSINMTSLHWNFSIEAVRQKFGLDRLEFISDFTALACAVLWMNDADLNVLHEGKPTINATRAIVGPGTGLSVAGIRYPAKEGT